MCWCVHSMFVSVYPHGTLCELICVYMYGTPCEHSSIYVCALVHVMYVVARWCMSVCVCRKRNKVCMRVCFGFL